MQEPNNKPKLSESLSKADTDRIPFSPGYFADQNGQAAPKTNASAPPKASREVLAYSFDKVAPTYKVANVGYPSALTDMLISLAELPKAGRILEVGSGTGAATTLFADKGYQIVCVEPGANMVKVARESFAEHPNVKIIGATFEDWPLDKHAFDLVFSARALHWVDPKVRFVKTADALRPGGSLAIFKNLQLPSDSPVDLALRRIIERFIPYPPVRRMQDVERQFVSTPHFEAPTERTLNWSCERDAHMHAVSQSIRLEYYNLSEPQRQELFSEMEKTIREHGGTIKVHFETHLLIARRRNGGSLWRRLTASRRRPATAPYSD